MLEKPEDLSGPSVGQCADTCSGYDLRLDDDRVHTPTSTSAPVHSAYDSSPTYVNVHAEAPPRLRHISANPRPVRQLVEGKGHPELVNA